MASMATAAQIVARALEETRAVELLIMPLLGAPTTHFSAILRLCLPVGFFSAVMNNTPIVAMLLSVVETWAAQQGLSAKVLLMPLSSRPREMLRLLDLSTLKVSQRLLSLSESRGKYGFFQILKI
mgnify:CR=1 FL=1